eukprot:m.300059 g.300059  ORF g.300059 m.300059 type:complete len:1020 (-) comp27244_c2_seq3:248-3307(-)
MEAELASYFDASLEQEDGTRRTAEEWLYQAAEQPGFVPATIDLLIQGSASPQAQHAASVFLKNICNRSWKKRMEDQYIIPEADKEYCRAKIFECMLVAPEIIRAQLKQVVKRMLEERFPEAFPNLKDSILAGLAAVDDERKLTATLAILYQLAKKFKYVKLEERVDYDLILVDALPQLLAIAEMCIENPSPDVLLILKLVVKVYHASSAYVLPSFIIEPEMFNSWMQLFAAIISIEVDEPDADDDPDELSQRPIWKLKKWTCRTLHILFQRYGTPSRCTREYKGFSDLYSETYSLPILELMWVQLQRYKVGSYMAPRVLTEILRYLENALEPAATWRHLKPLIPELLSDVLFPLLCFTEADLELWTDDAPEYIRRKLDLTVLAEINSPDIEAAVFVQDLIKIRQDAMTDLIFQFIHSVLQDCADPTTAPNPTAKDGALLMTSVIGNDLIGNRAYNHHLEEMLVTFVYPEFESEHGFLRARACQVFHTFSEIDFAEVDNIVAALDFILARLQDDELVVRVQAAVALRCLLEYQAIAAKAAQPHITRIVGIVLSLLNEAESDDLASVLDKMVELYADELIPHSNELLQQLIDQFGAFISNDLDDEEVMHLAMAALGTLNTIKSIVQLAVDDPKLLTSFEVLLLPLLTHVLEEGVFDFLDDFLDLMEVLTRNAISQEMWTLFPILHSSFRREMVDFFDEMCPVLYNYIHHGIGKNNFPPEMLDMLLDMCRTMFDRQDSSDIWKACKMMENTISWGMGNVDPVIPAFVGLAVTKLLDEENGDILMIACVNVVLSALRYNPEMVVLSMESASPEGGVPLLEKFFALWFSRRERFTGYHNRKLGILTLATLLQLPFVNLPPYLQQVWPHIAGMALFLFEKYEHAETLWLEDDAPPGWYAGDEEEEDDEEEVEDDDDAEAEEGEQIDDDADYEDIDADLADIETLRMIEEEANRAGEDEDDDGEHSAYPTAWDMNDCVWVAFGGVIHGLADQDAASAQAVFSEVTDEQQAELARIVDEGAKKAAKR